MSTVIDLIQGSEEWVSWRRLGIGGSDAPVIEGISPYKTARELFYEKSGHLDLDESENEFIFAKGHRVEGLIRKEFQDLVKAEIKPVCMQHDEFWHVRASLDGFHPKFGVLEAKLVGQEALDFARKGDLPAHHYSQMQHQFAVSGADVGQWFGHDGKKNGVLVEVRANKNYIRRLLDLEHVFWEQVQKNEPPPLSESDYLEPDDLSLLIELRDAKELAENAQVAFEALKAKAVEKYRHPKVQGGGVKLFRVRREGALTLSKVPQIAAAIESEKAKLAAEYIESFRSNPVESWTVQIEKAKKAAK